jgi:hypothetical protein
VVSPGPLDLKRASPLDAAAGTHTEERRPPNALTKTDTQEHRKRRRSADGERPEQQNNRLSGLGLPAHLARKAEALHLADRTSEALEAINEAEALAERFEHGFWRAEMRWLRAVFLAAIAADEAQIEASFQAAIRIAKEQKSISLETRAEATYAEYRRQKASGAGGSGFRLPLW